MTLCALNAALSRRVRRPHWVCLIPSLQKRRLALPQPIVLEWGEVILATIVVYSIWGHRSNLALPSRKARNRQFTLRTHWIHRIREGSQKATAIARSMRVSRQFFGVRRYLFHPANSRQHGIALPRRLSRTTKPSKRSACLMKLCRLRTQVVGCICMAREQYPGGRPKCTARPPVFTKMWPMRPEQNWPPRSACVLLQLTGG